MAVDRQLTAEKPLVQNSFDFDDSLFEDIRCEYDRLKHDDDCEGNRGHQCKCGCGTTIICPGGDLCRMRIMKLSGHQETIAVRSWMRMGLCICGFVIKNKCRHYVGKRECPEIQHFEPAVYLTDHQYTKASGNWSAKRRRKLVQCPCGAYFDNSTARSLGLLSESEWARSGFPRFNEGTKYYIRNAKNRAPYSNLPHVRIAPQPVARIWRPFYDPRRRRFEKGLASVDLFSKDQVDLSKFVLSNRQAIALMDGDEGVLKLLQQHPTKPKKRKPPKVTSEDLLRQYEAETGFSKLVPKTLRGRN